MKARNPRHGSMQFWPRVRAAKETPVVKSWVALKEAKLTTSDRRDTNPPITVDLV